MKLRGLLKCAIYSSVLALTLASVGCWNPFDPGGDGDGNRGVGDRKTPDHLLEFFATAYEDKSIERYTECLDDSYSFTFMEEDYEKAGVSSDKPYWGSTEDLDQTTTMFIDERTGTILFDFGLAVTNWDTCTDNIWVDDDEGGHWAMVDALCCTHEPVIDVTVNTAGEEPKTYQVRSSRIEITVIEDRFNPQLWRILRIEEYKK